MIDSHQHFWDLRRFTYRWMPPGPGVLRHNYLPEDLEPELRAAGIARTILVEAHNSLDETRFLLELADRHAWIAGVVGWVDLTDPRVGATLAELRRHPKLVGIRHQVESDPDEAWLIRPAVLRGLREVAVHELAFDLVVFPRHFPCILDMAGKVPDLRLVLDHLGKPPIAEGRLEPWASQVTALARLPHLLCKVSGMVTEADPARWSAPDIQPYVNHVVNTFGLPRLMWGSDWPVCLKVASYQHVLDLARELIGPLEPPAARAFFGETARMFYRLP